MSDNTFNFIKKTINALPLPDKGKRLYFYDTQVKGLELMVTDKGAKSFKVYRKFGLNPIRVTLGKYPEMTIEQARKEAQMVIAELIAGNNPNDKKRVMRLEYTFGQAFDIFMKRHSKINKKTWQADEKDIPRFLGKWFNLKLSQISKQDIQILHEEVGKENGIYQANRLLSRIQVLYSKMIEWGWEGVNPAVGIKKFKEKSRDRFIYPDELPRFMDSLAMEENDTIRDYIYICLLTGVRKSNVLEMRWGDINLDRREWLIPETKNGEALRVPLIDKVIEILRDRKDRYGNFLWVFPSVGRTGHLVEPKAGWKRILKRAGIDNLRLHDLRRTFGSYQAATGANSFVIGQSLGHKSSQSTAVYARLNIDPVRDSVERATEVILNQGKRI